MSFLLANRNATFTFEADGSTGMRLASFESADGSNTWVNSDNRLWQGMLFDTTGVVSTVLAALNPTFAAFSRGPFVRDGAGVSWTLTWTAIPMQAGTDTINVVLALRLNDSDDFLRATISANWTGGAARFALDSIAPLPLKIAPYQRGYDYAVIPSVEGLTSQDPLTFLRDPFFRDYPTAVGGWSMSVWGYYERFSKQGWMVWPESSSPETFRAQWTSDGATMVWSPLQYQPSNIQVANASAVLGSSYTWNLRPLTIRNRHGWRDIGKFYRQRLEATVPPWFMPVRTKRSDLSAQEKKLPIFADFSANDSTHLAGQPGITDALMASVRTHSLAPTPTPILLLCEIGSYRVDKVNETSAIGDLRTQIQSIYTNQNTFTAVYIAGGSNPQIWSQYRWFNTSALGVDSDDLRWWLTNDIINGLRMSRQGKLSGGGNDRLAENTTGIYYRERTYVVSSWNAGTRTATVVGSPSTDGFTGGLASVVIPALGTARLGYAVVQALGASTVQVTGNYTDGTDATVTPAPGDSIVVFATDGGENGPCPHATMNSTAFLRQLKRNTSQGTSKLFRQSGTYWDTWAPPQMRLGLDFRQFCYRDHSTWSQINGGYVPHPFGGGAWWVTAWKNLAAATKQAGRDAQTALGGPSFHWMMSEGISEPMMQEFDLCFHRCGSGGLWQTSPPPIPNKFLAVPLMSVVHAGRFLGRGLNQEFSSAALNNIAPFNDPALHSVMGYWLAYEWPHGSTVPTLSFFETTGLPAKDFFDDTQFISGGGSISNQVKAIRDLWVQITRAETNWLCNEGFRYGEYLGVGEIDPTGTDVTSGLTSTPYSNIYTSFDVIEENAKTPRVSHACWKNDDGSVRVALVNWTNTDAKLKVRLDTEEMGLGAPATNLLRAMSATRVDASRAVVDDLEFDPESGTFSVGTVAAYSLAVLILQPADLGDVAGDPRGDACSAAGFSI